MTPTKVHYIVLKSTLTEKIKSLPEKKKKVGYIDGQKHKVLNTANSANYQRNAN